MEHSAHASYAPTSLLTLGTKAPNFTLNSTPDQRVSLREFRGKAVIAARHIMWSSNSDS